MKVFNLLKIRVLRLEPCCLGFWPKCQEYSAVQIWAVRSQGLFKNISYCQGINTEAGAGCQFWVNELFPPAWVEWVNLFGVTEI